MTDVVEGRAGAPASSANLGPGFDTIALALDLHCFVQARPTDEWSIEHIGPEVFDGDASDDAIVHAAQRVSRQPLSLTVENHIPLSRGLGSSAAAFTAGSLAAMRAIGMNPDHDELFEVVQELEGHPDNAAAAVYGGLVAVADGTPIHLEFSEQLTPVVAVPGFELKTKDARRVLPETYDLAVISRTLGRYTGLVEGLRTASRETLALAAGDELHETPRTGLSTQVSQLIQVATDAGALHACWSGAGPSVIAFTTEDVEAAVFDALEAAIDEAGRMFVLTPDVRGAI